MAVGGATRNKRRLGRFMRPLVEQSALKPEELNTKGLPSRQTISRLLDGENLPRWKNFTNLLERLSVTHEQYRRAIEMYLVADTDSDAPVIAHGQDLPGGYMRFRMDEAEATHELTLDTMVFPGLLQHPDYAEAMGRSFHRTMAASNWNDVAAAERRDRQNLLVREPTPLRLHSLIDEAVLHRRVGDSQVMRDQLDHVLTMAAHDNVTVQVIPSGLGVYGAHSPFTLLTFPEDIELPEPDAAFVESMSTTLQIVLVSVAEGDPVDALSAVWHDVAGDALSPEDSTRFIEEVRDARKGNHG